MKKLGKLYDAFVILVIIIKVIFVVFAILTKFYIYKIKHSNRDEVSYYTKKYEWSNYWKERLETCFLICMGFICIIVFNPFYGYRFFIDEETRILLFLFGIIIMITSNWKLIF